MSRDPIAEAVLGLEKLRDPARVQLAGVGSASLVVADRVVQYVDAALKDSPRRLDLVGEVFKTGEQMRRAADDTATTVVATITFQMYLLRDLLWSISLAQPAESAQNGRIEVRRGGHLRDFTVVGEPDLPPGVRYEPTPLLLPRAPIDVDFARQGRLGNCYAIAAVNAAAQAVAQSHPEVFIDMVKPDPEDENFVIVTVHGGTYRLPATLPVDESTGREVFSTSPDGSTVVPYLEKAAAAHLGSWNDLVSGYEIYALWWLIGDRYPYWHRFGVSQMTDEDVHAVMTSGEPAFITIPARRADKGRVAALSRLDLVDGHAYTVRNDHPPTGHRLHNPWQRFHPNPVGPDDLRTLGAVLSWAGDTAYKPPVQPATEDLNT